MNNTPRTLNRILIGLLGLKLLAIGVLLVALAAVPGAGAWWRSWSAGVWQPVRGLLESTRSPGQQESWLWLVATFVLALVTALMVAWLAQQGKGRTGLLIAEEDPGDVPGDVRIGSAVAEQCLRAALADRPDLAGATVVTYEFKGEPALKIKVHPRQGVAPHVLAADIAGLVDALDAVLGKRTPVLIHLAAGARTRFGRAERVR